MRQVSQASLIEQIEREGAPWGLAPLVMDGEVWVAEPVTVYVPGAIGSTRTELRPICVLTMQHPLAGVLRHRMGRRAFQLKQWREARRREEEAEERRILEPVDHTFKGDAARILSGRQLFTGIMKR